MFFQFISAMLIGVSLIQLGSYAAMISMITNVAKMVVALSLVIAGVYLFRRFKGVHKTKPQALAHKT